MTSHQYALIPIAHCPALQHSYPLANPSTWQLRWLRAGVVVAHWGGIEAVQFTPAQRAELQALAALIFHDAATYQAWLAARPHDIELG